MSRYKIMKGGEVIAEWDIQYTIRMAIAGVFQYAEFGVGDDGKLINPRFQPRWVDVKTIPSLENLTFDEAMEVLEKFSGRKPVIHLINGDIPEYYKNPEYAKNTNASAENIINFIEAEASKFFDENILPIIKRNNWKVAYSWAHVPVLIYKNEDNEWDNVRREDDATLIEYISFKFLRKTHLDNDEEVSLAGEDHMYIHKFAYFMRFVPVEHLKEIDIFEEIE